MIKLVKRIDHQEWYFLVGTTRMLKWTITGLGMTLLCPVGIAELVSLPRAPSPEGRQVHPP